MRTRDGAELAVTAWGPADAPVTVVLAHCWTFDQQDWHYQVRDLYAAFGDRIRIVTWDHRGHGASSPVSRADATVPTLARDMGEVIDAYAPHGDLVIAGHSIGGMTMMALGPLRPDVVARTVGAVFVSTSAGDLSGVDLGIPGIGPLVAAAIPHVLGNRARWTAVRNLRRLPFTEYQVMSKIVFGSPQRRYDVEVAATSLVQCPPDSVIGYYDDIEHRHSRAGDLPAWSGVPTKVLVGTHDRLTPKSHARRIAAGIADAELIVAYGAGHMLPQERDELVTAAIADLVRPHVEPEAATA